MSRVGETLTVRTTSGSFGIQPWQRRHRVAVLPGAELVRLVRSVDERVRLQVERRVRVAVVVVDRPQRELAEAAVDQSRRQRVVVWMSTRCPSPPRLPVTGSWSRRALRLDDQLTDQAVAPAVDPVDVVVPEDVVEHDVGVPPLLDELGAGELARGVVGAEPRSQRHRPGASRRPT